MTSKKDNLKSDEDKKKEEIKSKIIKERVKKKKDSRTEQLFFNVLFAIVLGLIILVALLKWTPLLSKFSGDEKIVTNNQKNLVYEKSSLAPAIDNVYDSVVTVMAYEDDDDQESSSGSGFIYKKTDQHGYIITNQHVVAGAKKVKLVLSNDEIIDGKILGGDEYLDLAIIQISKDKVPQVAELGSSEDMKLGDTVFTIGSPISYEYRGSVTSGIISGKDRMVSVSVSNSTRNDWVMKVLQIDVAINPGNSGGPLVNAQGKVIGITSMKLVRDEIEGMGFAIPIELATSHIDELEKGKQIDWPLLGINMADIGDAAILYKNNIKVNSDIKYGVVVAKISEGSGASKSGLKVGDVITEINNVKVRNTAYLRYELYKNKPGESINITYIRDGKEGSTKAILTGSKTN